MTNRDVLKQWWIHNNEKLSNSDILSMILPIIKPVAHENLDKILEMYYTHNDNGKGIEYKFPGEGTKIKGYTDITIKGYPKDNYIKLIDENDLNSETRNYIENKWMYNGGNILPRISYLFNMYLYEQLEVKKEDQYKLVYDAINTCLMQISTNDNYSKFATLYFNEDGTPLDSESNELVGYFTRKSINDWKED